MAKRARSELAHVALVVAAGLLSSCARPRLAPASPPVPASHAAFPMASVMTTTTSSNVREHIPFDAGWRFAFGHPRDTAKDFGHATSYFSYLAKAGYADGPAAPEF